MTDKMEAEGLSEGSISITPAGYVKEFGITGEAANDMEEQEATVSNSEGCNEVVSQDVTERICNLGTVLCNSREIVQVI